MNLFFYTGYTGYLYLFSTVSMVGYLIYLSIVDIKLHKLEYWQTAGLFGVSVVNLIAYIASESHYLNNLNGTGIPVWNYLIIHLSAAFLVFIMLIVIVLLKKGNALSMGGADIWALTAVSLNVGILYLPYLLIGTCVFYLLFAFGYKIIKKKKLERVAFLPFVSIGTILTYVMLLV